MNPKFAAAARAAKTLLDDFLPPFAHLGACAGKAPNRAPLEEMFCDDLAYQRDPADYEWPAPIRSAIALCASCPVRVQCLAYEFGRNPSALHYGVFGGVPGPIRQALGYDPCAACKGKKALSTVEVGGLVLRFRDYKHLFPEDATGFPCEACGSLGRVRRDDAVERCADWFDREAERRHLAIQDNIALREEAI